MPIRASNAVNELVLLHKPIKLSLLNQKVEGNRELFVYNVHKHSLHIWTRWFAYLTKTIMPHININVFIHTEHNSECRDGKDILFLRARLP